MEFAIDDAMIRTPRMTVAQLKAHTDKKFSAVDRQFKNVERQLDSVNAKLDSIIKFLHLKLSHLSDVGDDHERRLQDLERWQRKST